MNTDEDVVSQHNLVNLFINVIKSGKASIRICIQI